MKGEASVVIVGAGPVGLSAALMLGRFGVDTLVIERDTNRSRHPRSRAVSCRTMELYRDLGIADKVRAAALPNGPKRHLGRDVISPWRAIVPSDAPGIADTKLGPETLQVVLCSQDQLEPVLVEAVEADPNITLALGAKVTDVTDTGEGVALSAVTEQGTATVTAKYLIAADGATSGVRTALGIAQVGELHLQTAVSVMFRSPLIRKRTGDPSSFIYIDNPETVGRVVIAPVDDGDRVAMLGRPLIMDQVAFDEIDWVSQVRAALGDPDEQVELDDARTWTVGAWVAERYQQGRIFLGGDAAHAMPPYGGFNQNTGVQDVHNLAWKLAGVLEGWADPALLETYTTERRPVADFNTAEAVNNFRTIIGNQEPGAASFRSENFVHPGLDIGFRYDQGAVYGAPAAPASWPVGEFTPTAAVGERAPHVWLDAEKRTSTLDLFGRELAILARVGSAPAAAAAKRAQELSIPHRRIAFGAEGEYPDAEWAAAYQVTGDDAVLVRPDGHVLARLTSTEHVNAALCAYTGRAAQQRARGKGSDSHQDGDGRERKADPRVLTSASGHDVP